MDKNPPVHDNFIRSILADKGIAADYFTASLPAFIRERLDFATLEQLPDSYVSDELRETVSDIVYSCRRKDGTDGVKISLLVEHKSYPDRHAPIQIGGYIFSGLLKQVRNGEKPSLIIPVLLYHGRDKWEYRTLKDLFGDIEPEWQKYVPDFDYIYHNLGEVPDEQLEMLNNNFLKASLLALKHSFERGWLEANATRLLVWSEDTAENLRKGFVVYFFGRAKLEKSKILKIMETLPSSVRKTVKSTADYFREEGREEGLQEGLQKGRQEGHQEGHQEGVQKQTEKVVRNLVRASGLADEQIAEMTEVSVDYVVSIRKEMKSGG